MKLIRFTLQILPVILSAIIIARDFSIHVDDLSDNTAKDVLCILQFFVTVSGCIDKTKMAKANQGETEQQPKQGKLRQ